MSAGRLLLSTRHFLRMVSCLPLLLMLLPVALAVDDFLLMGLADGGLLALSASLLPVLPPPLLLVCSLLVVVVLPLLSTLLLLAGLFRSLLSCVLLGAAP